MTRMFWSDGLIESELRKCIQALAIDRMPTASELKQLGRNDLHIKVCRTKKYSGWAEYLGLGLTSCETRKGQEYEALIYARLEQMGFEVERMTTKHAYDLLINGLVKIDVKVASVYMQHGKCRIHTFGINKKKQTCDIYVLVALDERMEIERTFVVPSHLAQVVTISMGKSTHYERFIDRWDYISQYADFLAEIQ